MRKMHLFPLSGKIIVAVSAGMDSMVLLTVLSFIKKKGCLREMVVCHVNHGTRPECKDEEKLVEDYCKKLKVIFLTKKMSDIKGNFEKSARDFRYQFFKEQWSEGDVICTAHHIDDSFETSLMQASRSSEWKSSLGIPVRQGKVVRPFLCVTRKQIEKFAQIMQVPFMHDSSNDQLNFDRNYVRHAVIPLLAKRYPQYLRHYVDRSNRLTAMLNITSAQENIRHKRFYNYSLLWRMDGQNDFYQAQEKILEEIKYWSLKAGTERGILQAQLQKLLTAAKKGTRGYLIFSGGVEVHLFPSMLYILGKEAKKKLIQSQLSSSLIFETMDLEKFRKKIEKDQFIWVVSSDFNGLHKKIPSDKKTHPLWAKHTESWLKQGLWFKPALAFLKYWEKNKSMREIPLFLQG